VAGRASDDSSLGYLAGENGVYGRCYVGGGRFAGYFNGPVRVNGDFTVSGGTKNFAIDHPLDPENRTLYHAAVESDEVLDTYSGNVLTDDDGWATVTLPAWFEAVNADFRYQLTVVGRFAQAVVWEEIKDNRFTIRTNMGRVKVSWQVTARRNDRWMRQHPFQAERDKPEGERGLYLTPAAWGQPEESGIAWAHEPKVQRNQGPHPDINRATASEVQRGSGAPQASRAPSRTISPTPAHNDRAVRALTPPQGGRRSP